MKCVSAYRKTRFERSSAFDSRLYIFLVFTCIMRWSRYVVLSISHLMLIDVIQRLKNGETVFLVTQYHQFCDLTAQSAHQAFCNFLSLLETHKRRHKWIFFCWRQSDNCYTYESKKICLGLTQVFAITGIHVLGSKNTEPNHGGKQADTSGANMKRCILHMQGWG